MWAERDSMTNPQKQHAHVQMRSESRQEPSNEHGSSLPQLFHMPLCCHPLPSSPHPTPPLPGAHACRTTWTRT